MLTNPNWNVHTDYEVNHVFKPDAANQLAATIPYDYVVTQDMLDWGTINASTTNGIDIARVLVKVKAADAIPADALPEDNAKKRISVMIDANTDFSVSLNFQNLYGAPFFATGASTNRLDIYCRMPFTFTGRAYPTWIYNHEGNRVQIPDTAVSTDTLYVGYMTCQSSSWTWSGTLVYEEAYSGIAPTGTNVIHRAWMTNKVPLQESDIEDLLPEVLIEYDNTDPVSSNYSAIQEVLGKGYSPVIYRDISLDPPIREIYHLSKITSCGFEFVDTSNNRKHYLATWTYSGNVKCQWDSVEGYPLPMVPDECVIVTFTYDASSHTWSSSHTGLQITTLIEANNKKIVLKVVHTGNPTRYLYNMESYGSNTYMWNTLYININTGEVDLFTYTLADISVSFNLTIIKSGTNS